jgi:hypothetical protein
MKYLKVFIAALFVFILAVRGDYVCAGSSQAGGEIYFGPEEIVKFSKKVEKTLAQKGARVAIIARVGRPRNKLPEGINFTHTAIAVYSQITTSDGRKIPGYAIQNLYQRADQPDVSDLIQDFPVDFFSGVEVLEAGIIIPSPELQKRLLTVLASPLYKELHNPKYSVIANPFNTELQNCTEHILDLIVAAIYETDDIKLIKANEKKYFEPQVVNVNFVKLFFGSMFTADVATSDHSGTPVTVTFTTIGKFLTKYNAASEILTITPDM